MERVQYIGELQGMALGTLYNYRVCIRLYQELTREELGHLFDSTRNLRDKCIFMTAYGAGLRLSEVAGLRVCDIDSERMQLFIRNGKVQAKKTWIL